MELAAWLATLPAAAPGHLLIGCTGHLLLSAAERSNAEQHLERQVFPALFRDMLQVTVVCGMAPGADQLFLGAAGRWLERFGIAVRKIALLPLPPDTLIVDWADKLAAESLRPDGAAHEQARRELQRLSDEADVVVELSLPGTSVVAEPPGLRQQQYRRLAAVLAEQTDVLVALLRDQQLQRPGGTAEVVEWRRHPRQIPAALSTLAYRHPAGSHRLWVVDPSQPVSA